MQINKRSLSDKLKEYKKSPMSALLAILVYLAGIITFAVLIYLVVYILVRGHSRFNT